MKMNIRKGDKVQVITGKDKGKQGVVLRGLPKEERVLVEGVNMVKKAMRPTQQNPQGGIVTKEAPIHVSNVMLVCPTCGKPTRVGDRVATARVFASARSAAPTSLSPNRSSFCERGFYNPRLLGTMTLPVCFMQG